MPGAAGVFTYYIAGIAVMLWMSPAMSLSSCAYWYAWRSPRFVRVVGLRANRNGLGPTGESHRTYTEVLAQISVVKSCVAEMRETPGSIGSRGRLCVYASVRLSRGDAWGHYAGATGARANRPAVYGGWSVMHGRIDLGTFVAFAASSRC